MTAVRKSLLRAALARSGGPALGTFVKLPSQESIELLALAGFDFIVIDMEHAPLGLETVFRQIGVAHALGVSAVVRVPGIAGGWIQRLLDGGVEGIMLPHTDTAAQAEQAVQAIRFEPWGIRGVGASSRAGGWGLLPAEEYIRFGQEEVVFMPQDSPELIELVTGVIGAARSAGLHVGSPSGTTREAIQSSVDLGYTFCVQSNDASLLGAAARAAVTAGRSVSFA